MCSARGRNFDSESRSNLSDRRRQPSDEKESPSPILDRGRNFRGIHQNNYAKSAVKQEWQAFFLPPDKLCHTIIIIILYLFTFF